MNEFLESLPEDIRQSEHLTGFESAGDLAKSYVDTKTADFKSQLPEDIRENEHLSRFENLGDMANKVIELSSNQPTLPESADGYTFEFPDGFEPDEADLKVFQETSFKHRLTQDQYNAVIEHDMARMNRIAKTLQENQEKAKGELQREYGAEYDANLEAAKQVITKFGGEELAQRVDIGDDPGMIKMLVSISKVLSEDALSTGKQPPLTPKLKTADDGTKILDYSNPVRGQPM